MTSVTNALPNSRINRKKTFWRFVIFSKKELPIEWMSMDESCSLRSISSLQNCTRFSFVNFFFHSFRFYRMANSSNFELFELYTFSMVFNLTPSYNTQYKVYFIQFNDLKVPKTLVPPPASQFHSTLHISFTFLFSTN